MAQSISEVMTSDPRTVELEDTLVRASSEMRDGDMGAVIVTENGECTGILTDRDIVVRAIAANKDPNETTVGEVATRDVTTLTPDQSVDDAIKIMSDEKVRRLPVVDGGRPVGIVSIGDLSAERDAGETLAEISAAPENN